jgi:hypothetical protein
LQGDAFVFGMAFWPGGTISSWCAAAAAQPLPRPPPAVAHSRHALLGSLHDAAPHHFLNHREPYCHRCRGAPYNTTSGAPGLNPCITNGTVTNPDGSEQSYQAYLVSGEEALGPARAAGRGDLV